MAYIKISKKKGLARSILFVLCNTCGTNRNVAYDPDADEYICSTCISHEQDVIDSEEDDTISEQEVLSEYVQNLMKEEETYRIKGDN